MAYSIQIYEFNTAKSVSDITKILQSVMKQQKEPDYKLVEVKEVEDTIMSSIVVNVNLDRLHYDITIRPADNRLIVQGSSIGRNKVTRFLAKEIEDAPRSHVITEYTLSIEQSIQLFQKITKEHNSNIIIGLRVQFEPEVGFKYARETYAEIAYKFTENRCASKHRDFEELRSHGKRMHMSMRLIQCTGLIPVENKGLRIDITPNCSFRLYTDRSSDRWNEFCFKIVDFL